MQVFLAKERGKTIRGTGGGKHAGFLGKGDKGEREKTIRGTTTTTQLYLLTTSSFPLPYILPCTAELRLTNQIDMHR